MSFQLDLIQCIQTCSKMKQKQKNTHNNILCLVGIDGPKKYLPLLKTDIFKYVVYYDVFITTHNPKTESMYRNLCNTWRQVKSNTKKHC